MPVSGAEPAEARVRERAQAEVRARVREFLPQERERAEVPAEVRELPEVRVSAQSPMK